MRQLLTTKRLTLLLLCGVLSACVSNNRPQYITSIGIEDLTQQKPVNVIIYHNTRSVVQERATKFDHTAKQLLNTLKMLDASNKLNVKNTATHVGEWHDVAGRNFNDNDYNWTLRYWDSNFPKIGFQNFSTDIASSKEVHLRFCQERTIQFANIPDSQLLANRDYWLKQFYPAAIQSLYLLMKGNSELTPIQVTAYGGKVVEGTKLGENDQFIFVLDGETEIYIVPKSNVFS